MPDAPITAQTPASAPGLIVARRGDDRAGHEHQGRGNEKGDDHRGRGNEKGDDHGGGHHAASQSAPFTVIARHGGNDGKGDDRGGRDRGRGRDDGPNHG